MTAASKFRLIGVTLDEAAPQPQPGGERDIAIHDLLVANSFTPIGSHGGPYRLVLGIAQNKLVMDVRLADGEPHGKVILSLTPFRRVINDYFQLCESYLKAVPNEQHGRIEALDMGRRGLHDEGAQLLCERLQGKIALDFDTARRLFTLIALLHPGG